MKWLVIAGIMMGLIAIAIIINNESDAIQASVPPTRAFSKIDSNGSVYYAPKYDSTILVTSNDHNLTTTANGLYFGLSRHPYAQISDLTTQQCAAAGAASDITLDTNDSIYGITHSVSSNTNQIIIQLAGIYTIIAVPQVGEATGQASGYENFWMLKNGINVPNTNIKTSVMTQQAPDETMTATLQWVGYLAKNDIVSFQQSCTDSDIGIIFTNSSTPPNTPSVIVTMFRLSG